VREPRSNPEISPEIFSLLMETGTLGNVPLADASAATLTLSDWSVLRACQYSPLPSEELGSLLQLCNYSRASDEQTTTHLPQPRCSVSVDLWDVIRRRRSVRRGQVQEFPLEIISALFANTLKTASSSQDSQGPIYHRPIASAGGKHPIDTYLVSVRVRSLVKGIHYYDPQEHSLRTIVNSAALVDGLVPHLCQALTTEADCQPALVLLFDLVVGRTGIKYGAAAGGLILRDLGCVLQQVHLVITALDRVGCVIGRLPTELVESILRLNVDRHIVLGGFAIW
jgi:SagB-type dehydrogenase family enzyme